MFILIDLDLSNFNSKNVNNMNELFTNCCFSKKHNLSNFDNHNVTEMTGIFLFVHY